MKPSELETLLTEHVRNNSELPILREEVPASLKALKQGDSIRLPGIGTFKVVERAARMGRNPRTGEQISIPARRQVKFTASKSLSEALKG